MNEKGLFIGGVQKRFSLEMKLIFYTYFIIFISILLITSKVQIDGACVARAAFVMLMTL